ncbi:Arm DNA-binding domain-containing protein [Pseudomonas sp. fls2-241-R2A-110]|uniref:Arm DNA-binding domain-containing protein n=1 Tax=Pseudomonas sp. fls2-241-R2A-110 TaxID=3040311 RepID=UPI002555A423|nr:Arm DNA-binding domain-containing protein [Pseudomonas sp. fls2-241-R2A-110]
MYLRVGPTGGTSWLFRYKLSGKSRYMTSWKHPETSLAVAREKQLMPEGRVDTVGEK